MQFQSDEFFILVKQQLTSQSSLQDQIQFLLSYLEKNKPKLSGTELNNQLQLLQDRYNSQLSELKQVSGALKQSQQEIQISQSPTMASLLKQKQKLETARNYLKQKIQFTEWHRNCAEPSVSTLEEENETQERFVQLSQLCQLPALKTTLSDVYRSYLTKMIDLFVENRLKPKILAELPEETAELVFERHQLTAENFQCVITQAQKLQKSDSVVTRKAVEFLQQEFSPNQIQNVFQFFRTFKSNLVVYSAKSAAIRSYCTKYSIKNDISPQQYIKFLKEQKPELTAEQQVQTFTAFRLLSKIQTEAVSARGMEALQQQLVEQLGLNEFLPYQASKQYAWRVIDSGLKLPETVLGRYEKIDDVFLIADLAEIAGMAKAASAFETVIIACLLVKVKNLSLKLVKGAPKNVQSPELTELLSHLQDCEHLFSDIVVGGKPLCGVLVDKTKQIWTKAVGEGHADIAQIK